MYSPFYQHLLCGTVSTIAFLSCQSLSPKTPQAIPKNLSTYPAAVLSGVMEVRYQNTTQNILFDIMISKAGTLKMDLTAVLSIPLMTVSINPEGLSTILFFSTKQYYQGRHPEKLAEKNLIPQFNLNLLKDILLDRRPPQKTWSCGYNKEKLPVQCNNKTIQVKWDRKTNRTLLVRTKDGQIKLYFRQFQPFTEKEIPDLTIPEHFKPIAVNLYQNK